MSRETHLSLTLAALATLGAALVGGCSSKPNDAQVVTNIQSQMFADAQLKNADLQVASINGQVTLKGSVPNDAARYEAYKIAAQTPGVAKVIDQMLVGASSDTGDQASAVNVPMPSAPTTPATDSVPAAAMAPPPVAPQAAPRKVAKPVKPAAKPKVHTPVSDSVPQDAEVAQNMQSSAPPSDTQQVPPPAAAPPPPAPIAAAPPPPPPPLPPLPQPTQYQVPAGTTVSIRMIDSVDSSVNQAGEVFHASLDAPIVVGNDVVVPKGADIYLRLASVSSAGKMTGQSELRLELVKLIYEGQSYPLVSSTYSEQGKSRGKDTAKKVGGGAILGAIIGGIAGGGKGAAIGATVGGGGGAVYQGATHGQQVKVPSETKLDFQLDQPATISVMPVAPGDSASGAGNTN
jgi:hypothetical protein